MTIPDLTAALQSEEDKQHDRQLCYEIMDELRECAVHCRECAEAARALGSRVALQVAAFLCDSGLAALHQCLRSSYPAESRDLEDVTEEAIQMTEKDPDDWRPGFMANPFAY